MRCIGNSWSEPTGIVGEGTSLSERIRLGGLGASVTNVCYVKGSGKGVGWWVHGLALPCRLLRRTASQQPRLETWYSERRRVTFYGRWGDQEMGSDR